MKNLISVLGTVSEAQAAAKLAHFDISKLCQHRVCPECLTSECNTKIESPALHAEGCSICREGSAAQIETRGRVEA